MIARYVQLCSVLTVALVVSACGDAGTARVVDPTSEPPSASQAAETAEPSSTPEPPAQDATVGDRIQLGDNQYFTVKEVQIWPGDDFIKADEGNQFVSMLVEVEGIDPEGSSYNPFFFSVKDSDGFEYNFSAFGSEPMLQSGNDLAAGDKVSGWVTFEMPTSVSEVVLTYQPDFLDMDDPARVTVPVPAG